MRKSSSDGRLWYDAQRPGLGDEFIACVEAAMARAARDPEAHERVHADVRRVLVRRFPFGVFYQVEDELLVVLAIAHVRRNPGYWLGRRDPFDAVLAKVPDRQPDPGDEP